MMKSSIKFAAFAALTVTASQALAFETAVERVGMLYLNIPLSNRTSAPTIDKTVMGFRFGQTRLSTDRTRSLFTYFRTRPALFDVQFSMVRRKNSPDEVHFGLSDIKLTGISSIERTYINGQAVVGGVIASKVLIGAVAVGGIGVAAAASGGGGSSSSDNTPDKPGTSTSPDSTTSNADGTSDDANDDASQIADDDTDQELDDDTNDVDDNGTDQNSGSDDAATVVGSVDPSVDPVDSVDTP